MRRSSSERHAAFALAMAIALGTSGARADDGAAAAAHLRRGVTLRKEHDAAGALAEFERANAIAPSGQARAQMGLAHQSLGQWTAAEADLRAALASDDPWVASYRHALEEALAYVGTHLGTLLIESNVDGAEVMLDGTSIGVLPLGHQVRVAAGTVHVRVRRAGYEPAERIVTIAAGERIRESIALVAVAPPAAAEAPLAAPAPVSAPPSAAIVAPVAAPPSPVTPSPVTPPSASASPAPARKEEHRALWLPIALISAGSAAVLVGAGFGVRALVEKGARDQHCDATSCDEAGAAFDRDARRDALASTITLSAGAVTGAVGLWLLARGTEPSRTRVAVVPSLGAHGASVGLSGAW